MPWMEGLGVVIADGAGGDSYAVQAVELIEPTACLGVVGVDPEPVLACLASNLVLVKFEEEFIFWLRVTRMNCYAGLRG